MILLVDSYDSFTNNLSCLIEKSTDKKVIVIPNDTIASENYLAFVEKYLDSIEYIVVGPGPGLPSNASDVGIISWLFKYFQQNPDKSVPILGICLGFQCLCYEFGNEVKRLENIKHGQIYDVESLQEDEPLYKGQYGKLLPSVRYHSLFIEMESLNSEIIPLAVCTELESNTKILMSGKHRELPFYGVQYHPESICTSGGEDLIVNFDTIAQKYNQENRAHIYSNDLIKANSIEALKTKVETKSLAVGEYIDHNDNLFVSVETLDFKDTNVLPVDICDLIVNTEGQANFILLNSASTPGEWSIIGIPEKAKSEVITHSVDNPKEMIVLKYKSSEKETVPLKGSELAWNFVANRFADNYVSRESILAKSPVTHDRPFPFLGGYLGLFSYEEGRHIVLDKLGKLCKNETPDLKLVFVERFLLYDHLTNKWFVFSVNRCKDDSKWCQDFASHLRELHDTNSLIGKRNLKLDMKDLLHEGQAIDFELPSEEIYKQQFQKCQEYLHSGDSYELCLTTPLKIYLPSHIESWAVYRILLYKNPSPFSCFMDFDDVVLISSSPERFLNWKGEHQKRIELRPIKGTVLKTKDTTIESATKILKTPKEMGENLMIVDLIRHDLHQFIDEIQVPYLMSVEEYTTVYQLVSVVRGELSNDEYHGVDILHTSLPPGSMTGAPKKRSVEILQDLESLQPNAVAGGRRGIYSGVVGYWSITDDSDWSVIIRSVYHYQDDLENTTDTKLWRIGAGGAITVLSNPEDEWEEMRIKLTSALQAFK